MKKSHDYLFIAAFTMMLLLIAASALKAYSVYSEKKVAEKEAQQRREEVLARNAESQNRVLEMESVIAEMTEDVDSLQAFIDETVEAAEEVKRRKEAEAALSDMSGDGDMAVSGDEYGYDIADVSGNANVSGNSADFGDMTVSGNVDISGNLADLEGMTVFGNGDISGNRVALEGMTVSGNRVILEGKTVSGNRVVFEGKTASGNAVDFDALPVFGGSVISRNPMGVDGMLASDNSVDYGAIMVSGNAIVLDGMTVSGNALVLDGMTVSGNTVVLDRVTVSGNVIDFGGMPVSGNTLVLDGMPVSGNMTVSVNTSGNDIYTDWQYIPPEISLEERRSIMPSYEETLLTNQADRETIAENKYDFSQMKIACLGDSITAASNLESEEDYGQYSYPSRLGELLGAKEVLNLGIGGSSIGRYWADPFVDRYTQIPEDTDIIIIMGGTNDGFCVSDEEFGNLGDRAPWTFCGDLDELMRGLRERYPSAVIFFATPLSNVLHDCLMSEKEYLLPQSDFADAIRTVAQVYGIETIDLYNSNILDSHDANVIAQYMPDGVHGNHAGYQILAEHFAAKIVQYYN